MTRNVRNYAWLLAAIATIATAGDAPVKTPLPVDRDGLSGQLSEFGGLRVLEVWGDAEAAGYAHGYLLAGDVVRLFDDYLLHPDIIGNAFAWEGVVLPTVARLFDWPEEARRELRAVYRGMYDALGEDGLFSERIDRALTLEDLLAANAYPDMNGFMCSTISIWGDLTADGETLTGRNLDFPFTHSMARLQIVMIRHASDGRAATAGITWPGAIGVFTAMSEHGVTMLMHDSNGHRPADSHGFTPRALILREALEAARPESFVEDVQRVLASRRVLIGNNVHVSAPRSTLAKQAAPAVVFEYDGGKPGNGVTVRRANPAAGNTSSNSASGTLDAGKPAQALWCTNHMRARRQATDCKRYEGLLDSVAGHQRDGQPINADRLFEMMHAVRQRTTLHTVTLHPAGREMLVRIPALTGERVTRFELEPWLNGRQTAPAERR